MDTTEAAALEELFRAPPSEFAARRNALAKTLRDAGRAEGAASVAARKKPTQIAYLLNQLARRRPRDVEKLSDLGRDLTRAQRSAYRTGGAGDLRDAVEAQRRAVAELVTDAVSLAGELDVAVSRHDLYEAFLVAIADPAAAAALEAGMLSSAPHASGELEAWSAPASGPRAARPATHASIDTKPTQTPARAREAARRDEAMVRQARRRAEATAREREKTALAAEHEVEVLQRAAEAAKAKLDRARRDAQSARADAESARRALESVTAGAIAGGGQRVGARDRDEPKPRLVRAHPRRASRTRGLPTG